MLISIRWRYACTHIVATDTRTTWPTKNCVLSISTLHLTKTTLQTANNEQLLSLGTAYKGGKRPVADSSVSWCVSRFGSEHPLLEKKRGRILMGDGRYIVTTQSLEERSGLFYDISEQTLARAKKVSAEMTAKRETTKYWLSVGFIVQL